MITTASIPIEQIRGIQGLFSRRPASRLIVYPCLSSRCATQTALLPKYLVFYPLGRSRWGNTPVGLTKDDIRSPDQPSLSDFT